MNQELRLSPVSLTRDRNKGPIRGSEEPLPLAMISYVELDFLIKDKQFESSQVI